VITLADIPNVGGTQIMGTVGINYMPAIQASAQCVTALEAVSAALRNTQAVAKQHGAVFANDLAKQVSNQGIIYDRYGGVLAQVGAKTETVTQQVEEHSKSVKKLANSHTFLQHRMGWFVSGTMFYGTIKAAKQAVEAIKEVETGMVIIRRVANDATIDFDKMRTELLQAGIDFGHSWDVVQEAATRWALAGYRGNEIIELTRTSLLGLNVAEMDINMATQGLIAIMAQWGFETHELVTVIDKLNKTSDNYAVTTGDLVEALVRSSGAARALNLTFEETVGLITATRVASGRLGREVGNALNTIFSYITRQATLNKMAAAGIDIYADSTKTKLKPAMQLLTEFAERWSDSAEDMPEELVDIAESMGLLSEEMEIAAEVGEEWTELQKIGLEQSMAGVRRRNFLIALLRNFAMSQEVVNGMLEVEGYSMRQNAETMETLEKRVNALKTAFTMLAVEMGEAGLLAILKGSVENVTALLKAFEKLPPELKTAIILLGEAAAVFGVVNLTAKTFFSYDIAKKLMDINKATKAATTATVAYTGVTGGATLATNGFALSLHGLTAAFMKLPIVGQIAILAVLAGTIYSLTKSTKTSTKAMGEAARESLEAGRKTKELIKEIETLSKRHERLTEKEERTNEETELLKKTTGELAELLPNAVTGFDDMGKAVVTIESVAKASRMELEKLNKEMERSIIMGADAARTQLTTVKEERDRKQATLDDIWAAYESDSPVAEYRKLQQKYGWREEMGYAEMTSVGASLDLGDRIPEVRERTKDSLREWYDELNEDFQETLEAIAKMEKLIQEADILSGKIKPKPLTGRDPREIKETPAQAYERLNAERAELRHQLNIGATSTAQYLATLERIERDMRAAGIEEQKIWSIQEEIYSLKQQEGKSYQQWTDEQKRLAEEREREIEKQSSEYRQFYDTAFNDAMGYYRHVNSLARSSRDEQIQYLKDLSRAHEWEKSKMWTLEEELFRLYQGELKDQQKEFENAYNARIKAIERERDLKIQSIQDQIDALDEEKQSDGRTEAERQHNQKMADLLKQKQYHELRTGAEHAKAIVDIERQMNEESRDWERQIDDWRREDRKEVLQKQIEDIKKKADEEKEIWKQKYEEIKANWDNWADNFAEAAINDPRWLNIGKTIGGQLASGFSDSIEVLDRRIANVGNTVSDLKGSSGFSSGTPVGHDILNPHYQYIEQTWAGGAKAYIEAQQKRYTQAKIDKNYDLYATARG
jgi:TP901 family phage tail tape measure protein